MTERIMDSNEFSQWEVIFHNPSDKSKELYYALESVGRQIFYKSLPLVRSDYNCFLILLTLDGRGTLKYKGINYTLNPGDFFFIDCNILQEYMADGDMWENCWISFWGQNSRSFYEAFRELAGGVVANPEYAKEFRGMVSRILELKSHNDMNFDPRVSAIIYKMLVDIMILLKNKNSNSDGEKRNANISAAIKYINTHYQKDIQLDDIADHIFINKFHLIRIFKAATGYSPYEYLLNLRIDKSKEYLLYTNEKIEDIALRVGFTNTSCFINAFKRREGKTPLKYRNSL